MIYLTRSYLLQPEEHNLGPQDVARHYWSLRVVAFHLQRGSVYCMSGMIGFNRESCVRAQYNREGQVCNVTWNLSIQFGISAQLSKRLSKGRLRPAPRSPTAVNYWGLRLGSSQGRISHPSSLSQLSLGSFMRGCLIRVITAW
jgi:hypothetical protein